MSNEKNNEFEKVIEKLMTEYDIKNLLSFSELDIKEKLANNAYQLIHFTELYQKEKNDLDIMNDLKDQLTAKKYQEYKNKEMGVLKQAEIEKYYLPSDSKIIKINDLIRKQKWRVDFFQGVVKSLDKQQWAMQGFLNTIKQGL